MGSSENRDLCPTPLEVFNISRAIGKLSTKLIREDDQELVKKAISRIERHFTDHHTGDQRKDWKLLGA